MNILLDTYVALWAIIGSTNLSDKARELICDPDNNIYFSSVSTWEVLIKHDAPRTNLDLTAAQFAEYCVESGYYQLNIKNKHVIAASELNTAVAEEHNHRDPFDRMLLAQAKSENYAFVTHDSKIEYYNEKCVIMV